MNFVSLPVRRSFSEGGSNGGCLCGYCKSIKKPRLEWQGLKKVIKIYVGLLPTPRL